MPEKIPITLVYPGPSPHALDFFNALYASSEFDIEALFAMPRFVERPGWPVPKVEFPHEFLPVKRLSSRFEFAVWNPGLSSRIESNIERGRIHLIGGGYTMPSIAAAMRLLNRHRARWFYFSEKPGISHSKLKSFVRRQLIHSLLLPCSGILAHSPLAVDAYVALGFPKFKLHFLPYYMNVSEFHAIERSAREPNAPLRILYCGRLHPLKGLDWAIEAFTQLGDAANHFHLTVMGDGPDRALIQSKVERLKIPNVEFIGECGWNTRHRFFADHDLLLFPSRHDGWGMAVMEALASGMPVLGSTNAGAVAAYVRDGVNGWTIKPEDSRGLRDRLLHCIHNRGDLAAMGIEARRSVADWTPEIGANRLRAILTGTAQ